MHQGELGYVIEISKPIRTRLCALKACHIRNHISQFKDCLSWTKFCDYWYLVHTNRVATLCLWIGALKASRGQFHQHFTQSFYSWRSPKCKKDSKALLGSACVKALRKMLVKSTPAVNYMNILRAAFATIYFHQKIQSQTVIWEKLRKAHSYKKVSVKCWWNWHLMIWRQILLTFSTGEESSS